MLLRSLLTLLIVILTLSASGISSVMASTMSDDTMSDDDCCADGAGDEAPGGESPDGERDRCPPLCHACACSPIFSVPSAASVEWVVRSVERHVTIDGSSQLPVSPPGRGVFHPPRRAA